jgi:hypothetical protein
MFKGSRRYHILLVALFAGLYSDSGLSADQEQDTASTPSESRLKFRLLEVDRVDVEAYKNSFYRDPYINQYSTDAGGDEYWIGGAAVSFNLTLLEIAPNWRLYWNNRVHMDGTNKQVRHVGWWWDLGLNMGPKLDLFYNHHSRHCLECNTDQGYPLRDSIGVRFKMYRRPGL